MAYTLNDVVLKILFGRLRPTTFYQSHIRGVFHLFRGDDASSFPSGHMVLATAFLGVFVRLYLYAVSAYETELRSWSREGFGLIAVTKERR